MRKQRKILHLNRFKYTLPLYNIENEVFDINGNKLFLSFESKYSANYYCDGINSNIGFIDKLIIKKRKLSMFKIPKQKTISKVYREDLTLWESKKQLLGFINYHIYSIWKEGKTIKRFRLIKIKTK